MPIPTSLWAQRQNEVFITIDVQDVKDAKTNLDNVDGVGKLAFSGKSGETDYDLELNLYRAIDVASSQVSVSPRCIFLVIAKAEPGYWPRLTQESGKHALSQHIKCDWNKWVDEDEEEEAGKMDFSQYGNFSGFGGGEGDEDGGAGGFMPEDEEDSDNEELPDLVK